MVPILLSLYYYAYHSSGFADAYPVHAPGTVHSREEIVFVSNYRSTFDIIWSCLATVFACTWVAMHPDVPKDSSTWWGRYRGQFLLFGTALLAPELVMGKALYDWHRARIEMGKMAGLAYTSVQCQFLAMGGVAFRTDEDGLVKFDARDPTHLEALKKLPIDLEITARSKSNPLAKSLVVIQVSWFILQCIARGAQRLAITELEIVTLAYAVLNGVVYALWWNKPASVEVPVIIDISKGRLEAWSLTQDDRGSEAPEETTITAVTTLLTLSEEKPHDSGSTSQVADILTELPPTYWFPLMFFSPGIVGSIFGALHCIALSFQFPAPVAFTLWKGCALYITISPLPIMLLTYWYAGKNQQIFLFILPLLLTIGYAVARIILVVVSFWALTSIPQSGHQTVVWTKYIPHM